MVLIGLDNGCKLRVDLHGRSTVYELSLSKVFEPVLRALHAVQEAMFTVRMRYGTTFCSKNGKRATNDYESALKESRNSSSTAPGRYPHYSSPIFALPTDARAPTVASATHAIALSGISVDANVPSLGIPPNTKALTALTGTDAQDSDILRASNNTLCVAVASHAGTADSKHAYVSTMNGIRGPRAIGDTDNSGTAESNSSIG